MTQLELDTTLQLLSEPDKLVKALQVSSFDLPKWSDLEKQYNPDKHSIYDTVKYPVKLNENGQDEFKRTALALQKLAVNRLSQAMFATGVTRQYDYDRGIEAEQTAVDVLEMIYSTQNYIDSENIERAKRLNASCQVVTIWRAYSKETKIKGLDSKMSLTHATYSEMDGYKLYPQIDENGNLIVIAIEYTDSSDIEHFDIYAGGLNPQAIYLTKEGNWQLTEGLEQNPQQLSVFPVIYAYIKEPVWGGDSGTGIVEQLEEMESFDGLYIKKNAAPAFTLDMGDTGNGTNVKTDEKADQARRIIRVGKGGKMDDVSWTGAGESLTRRYNRLRNAFFEQIQIPDTSFANMIASNTSAENKELIFADAKAKAIDLGGEWQRLFYNEMNVVIEFAKIMFPSLTSAFENISVKSIIKPYNVKNEIENAEFVANAGSAMSLETKVRKLGQVRDIEAEVAAIQEEQGAAANQGIL